MANKFIENNDILIEKQELIKYIYCGETANSMKNKNVISIIDLK